MNLKVPQKDPQQLILYLWKIIDLPKISKKDLLYDISFKFFLVSPSGANKLIQQSIKKGYLTQNPDNTLSLSNSLEQQLNSWQQSRKNKIVRRQQLREKQASDLKELKQSKGSDFSTLLKAFLDKGTLNRAVTVSEDSFNIKDVDLKKGIISGDVSGSKEEPYIIEINSNEKVLKHNCHDFRERRAPNKKFCKHLAKLFILLKEKKDDGTVVEFLGKIGDSINEWDFKA
jgi:hypothetical protein